MNIRFRKALALLGAAATAVGLTATAPSPAAADAATSFVPFTRFLSDVSKSSYGMRVATGRIGVVRDAAAFAEMRSYVLDMYQGVEVRRSFVNDDNQHFDCVTVESQPSLRHAKEKTIAVPATPPKLDSAPPKGAIAASQDFGGLDRYGNAKSCAEGTIPMLRITLERLANFPTVKDFTAKGPGGDGRAADGLTPSKHYAHGYQNVPNRGGRSIINLWDIPTTFSISQQWYIATNGPISTRQTVEGGTLDYKTYFSTDRAALFVYFTADNYQSIGCYNLDCPGFVQTNPNWALGSGFGAYSVFGGEQVNLIMSWYFTGGNWWLYLYRGEFEEAVGYYPAYLYGSGPLSSGAGQTIDYGGEVNKNGAPGLGLIWPPMGSGYTPALGYRYASYQRNIYYFSASNTAVYPSLIPNLSSPYCYQVSYTPQQNGGDWGAHLYFGGPGTNGIC